MVSGNAQQHASGITGFTKPKTFLQLNWITYQQYVKVLETALLCFRYLYALFKVHALFLPKAPKLVISPLVSVHLSGPGNQPLKTERQSVLYFILLTPCMKQCQNMGIFGNLFLWVFGTCFYELVYFASHFSSYLLKITTWTLRGCQRITSQGRILLFSLIYLGMCRGFWPI